MLYMTKEKFEEICKKYPSLLVVDGDVSDALNFVQDLLEAEADALKEREPHAVKTIERLNQAAHEVFDVLNDIEGEEFLETDEKDLVHVDFRAGYYSWDVFVKGEHKFSFEVDSERFDGMDSNCLRDFIEELIDAMQAELEEDGKVLLDQDEVEYLQDQMYDAWMAHFDIELVPPEGEPRVVRTMEELKGYLEENGWKVSECTGFVNYAIPRELWETQREAFERKGWEITTEAFDGDSWGVTIYHNGDASEMIQKLRGVADTFDAKRDAEVWATEEGKRSPSKALVEALEKVGEKLKELAYGVVFGGERALDEMISNAEKQKKESHSSDEIRVKSDEEKSI